MAYERLDVETMAGSSPTREELVGQIRFALSELATSNGHHRFEDLCRNFARERLVPNILPATGPVGVGGDQGRDFETFRSYLREEIGPHGSFAGRLQDGAVAFACTMQQDGLSTKLRDDVAKIMSGGTTVVQVYAFLTAPLPVATRHGIQEAVRNDHDVELEVFDGSSLAEVLADHELFWIAEQYLALPASLRPKLPEDDVELPDWYRESRDRWRKRGQIDGSVGRLSSAVDGLRHATFTSKLRSDLPFWLDLIRPLAVDSDALPEVRRRAQFEVVFAELRGLGSMQPADELARRFLVDALGQEEPAVFSDAEVLLRLAVTAASLGHSNLDSNELARFHTELRSKISALLDASPLPTRRARLLEVLGRLLLIPDPRGSARPDPHAPEQLNAAEMIDLARDQGVPDEVVARLPAGDLEGAMQAWRTLASLLEETPLFPVESWSRQLEFLSPLLVDQPGWIEVEAAVDDAIERLHGGDAAASRARDRAVRLQNAGRLRDALAEFHKAKLRWWNGDSLRGALLCMLSIAELYKSLHMPLAGKQYALTVAEEAHASDMIDLVPVALMTASGMDYTAGAWISAVELADMSLRGDAMLVDTEVSAWAASNHNNAINILGMTLRAARGFRPEIAPMVEDVARCHGMLANFDQIEAATERWDEQKWTRISDTQLMGRPLSDLGPERIITFAALGTKWTIRAPNEYRDAHAAERLVAAAQIVLVELADDDLCLLPAVIQVEVRLENPVSDPEPQRRRHPDGSRCWSVALSPVDRNASEDGVGKLFAETIATVMTILFDVSLLSLEQYREARDRVFERGLNHKLAIGRPYDELAELVPESRFDQGVRKIDAPFAQDIPPPREHPELRWQDGPGIC